MTDRQDPKPREFGSLTQEAPEIEATRGVTHWAKQAATQEATREVTWEDLQMTEEGCTEDGDGPKGKRAAAFTEEQMKPIDR